MALPHTVDPYPLTVTGRLDPQLSRWLWLVKWILAIPHLLVLAFLWLAFGVVSVLAFVAILATGRYPRGLFDFNVGVLRWTWRVAYYSFAANGTDRYPPFTLEDVPDYPAHLDVDYPTHLSRGLVLVKWWLLALPHYVVVALLTGGGYVAWRSGENGSTRWEAPGLIEVLVLVAVVVLLVTGAYPRGLFDLVLGLNRWVLRVVAYAGLMTDRYPPFRLDSGGDDPGALALRSPPPAPPGTTGASPAAPTRPPRGASGGNPVLVVVGALLTAAGLALAVAGAGTAALTAARGQDGFVMTGERRLGTDTAALVTEEMRVDVTGPDWLTAPGRLGTLRVEVEPASDGEVFVGLASESDVSDWLGGVAVDRVRDVDVWPFAPDLRRAGGEVAALSPPGAETFWLESSAGAGRQTLSWDLAAGDWALVVANADGTPGVDVEARAGAALPALGWLAAALGVGGLVLIAGGIVLVVAGASRRGTGR